MVDLRHLPGRNYRVVRGTPSPDEDRDEVFGHPTARQDRIPCRHGSIFVGYSGGLRALCTNRRIIPLLNEIPDTNATHTRWEPDGHASELTVAFPIERLDEIAVLLKAKRRRHVSEETRARLAAIRPPFPAKKLGARMPQDVTLSPG
jgi:hypothetical protein